MGVERARSTRQEAGCDDMGESRRAWWACSLPLAVSASAPRPTHIWATAR